MKSIPLAALLSALTTPLFAHDYTLGDITISHPFSYETPQGARAGAGYMTIENASDASVFLMAVEADFPRVMLHETVVTADVMSMEHRDRVEIPAGETVRFEPGGLHVMFMGLEGPLAAGTEIPATLMFENAGSLEIIFNVQEREAN